MDVVIRLLIGGAVVSVFALLGEALQPKSFAGLFAAAPSVALASLGLSLVKHGADYSAVLGRSMILGAAAFFVYSLLVAWLLATKRGKSGLLAGVSLAVWLAGALGLWLMLLA